MECQDPALILPIELWRECWMHSERDDILMISGTCHLFNDLCRPLLFKSLICTTKIEFGTKCTAKSRSARCKAIEDSIATLNYFAGSSKHAHLFRHCSYSVSLHPCQGGSGRRAEKLRGAYESYILAFVANLPLFTQLRSIRFGPFTDVDIHFADALARLPHLEEAHFESCRLDWFGLPPMVHLKTLTVSEEQDEYDLHEASNALRVFSVQRLEKLTTQSFMYTDKILLGLFRQGVCEHLTHLTIYAWPNGYGILRNLLAHCPVLDTLSVEEWADGVDPDLLQPLPGSSAPILRKFEGPGVLAKAIVPGHPVKVVLIKDLWSQLDFSDEPLDVLRDLTKSTGPVANLALPHLQCRPQIMTAIAIMFPHLIALQLTLVDDGTVPFRTSPEHHMHNFHDDEGEDDGEGEGEGEGRGPVNGDSGLGGGSSQEEYESPPGETTQGDSELLGGNLSGPGVGEGGAHKQNEQEGGVWVHLIPVDEDNNPSRPPTSYPGLLDRLAFGKLPLPQGLILLYLYRDPSYPVPPSTEAIKASEDESLLIQATLLGRFKRMLPALTKVVLGVERPWYYWHKTDYNLEKPWSLIYRDRFPDGSFEDRMVDLG